MANVIQIAETVVGKQIDVDGYPAEQPFQCTDLIVYVGKHFGIHIWGNGNQMGIANGSDIYNYAEVVDWYEGIQLQAGDIISLDIHSGPSAPYGHVVIYAEGLPNNALIYDQNYGGIYSVTKRNANLYEGMTPLRVIRFKNQDNYTPISGGGTTVNKTTKVPDSYKKLYEIICEEVNGVRGINDPTVVDTFYKCNKVTGEFNGEWFIYNKYDGSKAYLPKGCVNGESEAEKEPLWYPEHEINEDEVFSDTTEDGLSQVGTQQIYSLGEFVRAGRIEANGYQWIYKNYKSYVGKNASLNDKGFLADNRGRIILDVPTSFGEVKGNVIKTPFGHYGIMEQTHEAGDEIIVYIR